MSCSLEDFLELIRLDIPRIISKINGLLNENAVLHEDQLLINTVSRISSEVFVHEKLNLSVKEMRSITIDESVRFIMNSQEEFDIREFIPVSDNKTTTTELRLSNKYNLVDFREIIKISDQKFEVTEITGYNINGTNNTVSFIEQLAENKELYSETITIKLNPGKYSKFQLFQEIGELMSMSSKVNNFYSTCLNTISMKATVISMIEPLSDHDDGTYSDIRDTISTTGKGLEFKLIQADPLGEPSESQAFSVNQELGSKFKIAKENTVSVSLSTENGCLITKFDINPDKTKCIKLPDFSFDEALTIENLNFTITPRESILAFNYTATITSLS